MKILFVEDNPDFRDEICFQLTHDDHEVIALDAGRALLDWLDHHPPPDLLLLDLGLPDIDGLELAERIRARHSTLMITMLTARGEVDERVKGWNAGADAYLTKPVSLSELRAVLARQAQRLDQTQAQSKAQSQPLADQTERQPLADQSQPQAQPTAACWRLDPRAYQLINPRGEGCPINTAECALLRTFADSDHEPVSRGALIRSLGYQPWDYDARRLESAVSRLRKKIVQLGGSKELLRPVRAHGYLFAGQLIID